MLFCISFICPVCQQRRLTLRLHTAVFTCKVQMNVIMHPLPFFFFFAEHFVQALIYALSCFSTVALHLFPFKAIKRGELCAGFNCICVEICCNICPAVGQVKYSYFTKAGMSYCRNSFGSGRRGFMAGAPSEGLPALFSKRSHPDKANGQSPSPLVG